MSQPVEHFLGGENYPATLRDGTVENVVVQHFGIRKIIETIPLLDDEPGMVEQFCSKPRGWADSLTPASYEEILEKGWAANYPTLAAYLRRQNKMREEFKAKYETPLTKP